MNGNAGPGIGGFSIFDGVQWSCANVANYGLGPAWSLPSDDVDEPRVHRHARLEPYIRPLR